MSRFRRNLLLSGLGGLLVSLLLAGISSWMVASGLLQPPLPYPTVGLLLALILAGFSLAEVPMMIVVMRRLATERTDNGLVVPALNALYVLFAAVYGAPVNLLTGSLGWGLGLCALSTVRFVTSLAFIKEPMR